MLGLIDALLDPLHLEGVHASLLSSLFYVKRILVPHLRVRYRQKLRRMLNVNDLQSRDGASFGLHMDLHL